MASYADSNFLIYDRDSTGHSFVFDCASATAAGQKVNIAAGDTTLTAGTMATTADLANYAPMATLAAMREPTGFADRTKSAITFTVAGSGAGQTRVFDIAHAVDATFDIYSGGVKYSKTHDSVAVPDVTGLYYIYYSTAGELTCGVVNTSWDLSSANVAVGSVYWNADLDAGLVGDERHGIQMDGRTQEYLHDTHGSAYGYGLGGTFGADGSTLSISAGEWHDEDVDHANAVPLTQCRVLYRDAAAKWKWSAAQNGYYSLSAGSTPAYDDGSGTLASVGVAKFSHSWVFITNDPTTPIYVIMGQDEYNTSALANAVGPESLSLGTLPVAEMLLLYRVTWQRDSAVIKSPTTADYRRLSGGPVSNYTPTDHASLQHLDAATSGHTGFVTVADAQTLTGKKTFPSDGTSCPVFQGDVAFDVRPAFAIKNDDDGTVVTLNVYADSNASGDCVLVPGYVYTNTNLTASPLVVAQGGTGASTLAGAGITTFVGTPWDGVGLTGDTAAQTLLATSHAAGFYRISVYFRCTTAGSSGSFTLMYCAYNDGAASGNVIIEGQSQDGARSVYYALTSTSILKVSTFTFYSSGSAAITCWNGSGTYNTSPAFTVRARLEYLGA